MKKALVTGECEFIGSHLVEDLINMRGVQTNNTYTHTEILVSKEKS